MQTLTPSQLKLISLRVAVERERRKRARGSDSGSGARDLTWQGWLAEYFPTYVRAPFAPRHLALWEWVDALTPGLRPRPFVAIWPRGGAKSTSVELGCAWQQQRRTRRFVLYVSGTQAQANGHVQSVATLLERLGVSRALNIYGASKGWKQQELRAAGGFNARAFGLDAGARGVKIDDARPDLIIFDDVDDRHDSLDVVQKKIETITQTILPAGSDDLAVLFVQNRIHANSVASMLADNTAGFLLDRLPVSEEPAVRGLQVVSEPRPDGEMQLRVVAGEPTWEGQDLAVVEHQLNTWGREAFMREAQHEVKSTGPVFQRQWFRIVDAAPPDLTWVRYWDLAASTKTSADYTACAAVALHEGTLYVRDMIRGRWEWPDQRRVIVQTMKAEPRTRHGIEEALHGLAAVQELRRVPEIAGMALRGIKPEKDKISRALPWSQRAADGKVVLIRGPWVSTFLDEVCLFDGQGRTHDDQVDTVSGGVAMVARGASSAVGAFG